MSLYQQDFSLFRLILSEKRLVAGYNTILAVSYTSRK